MKNFIKKGFLLSLVAVFGFLMLTPSAEAKRGCCSWHGWVNYCASNGRYVCNDGTYSPSCTCGSSYTPTYTKKSTYKKKAPSYTPSYTPEYSSPKQDIQPNPVSSEAKEENKVDYMRANNELDCKDPATVLSCSLWTCPEMCKNPEVAEAKKHLWNKVAIIESIAKEVKLRDAETQMKIRSILDSFRSSDDEYTKSVGIYLDYLLK